MQEQCSAYPGEGTAVSKEPKVTASITARAHVEFIAKALLTDVCAVKKMIIKVVNTNGSSMIVIVTTFTFQVDDYQ